MLKKLIVFFFLLTFTITLALPVVAVPATTQEKDIIAEAENIIKMFYENKDMGAQHDLSKNMDKDILSYLTDKITVQQQVVKTYNTAKENYAVRIILRDKEDTKDYLKLKFQVISTCNYSNLEDETTVSEVVKLLYNCERGVFTDFYTPLNYYDVAVRNNEGNYDANGFADTAASDFALTADIAARQAKLKKSIGNEDSAEDS